LETGRPAFRAVLLRVRQEPDLTTERFLPVDHGGCDRPEPGRIEIGSTAPRRSGQETKNLQRSKTMPVILLWGIPTLIVLGGGTYWLMHLH